MPNEVRPTEMATESLLLLDTLMAFLVEKRLRYTPVSRSRLVYFAVLPLQ